MKIAPRCSRLILSTLLALTAGCAAITFTPSALATDLPPGVLNYLRQKDPSVRIRFDGLILFSNGETYVPVIPQDPSLSPDPQQVVMSAPQNAPYPDLVEFDNHFFLMRLIQTASGRLTFPKMDEYPLQLKEGLLPQDFVLPNNLFIPVELKVILGALPYNPSYKPAASPVLVPPAVSLGGSQSITQRLTYVFDVEEQKLLAIEPWTGKKESDVPLDCVPSNLRLSPDGKMLFVPCLSTNELVVVDTGSNLVKTRIPVGQRPDATLYLPRTAQVAVSHRYSPFLSLINTTELVGGEKIDLPGNGGAMALVPSEASKPGEPSAAGKTGEQGGQKLVAANTTKPQVYLVDVNSRSVVRTINSLPNISALKVLRGAGGYELWVASRSQGKVQVQDLATGNVLHTFDVGEKPVDFAVFGNKLYVVSGGAGRLDVIDWTQRTMLDPIAIEEDGFPSGIISLPSEERAFVTTAGAKTLAVVNLKNGSIEKMIPVDFRASMITMTPDDAEDKQDLQATQTATDKLPSLDGPTPAQSATDTAQTPTSENAETAKPVPTKGSRFLHFGFGKTTEKTPAATGTPAAKPTEEVATPQSEPAQPTTGRPPMPAFNPSASSLQGGQYGGNGGKFSFQLGRSLKKHTDPNAAKDAGLPDVHPTGARLPDPTQGPAQAEDAVQAAPAATPTAMPTMMDEQVAK